MQFRIPLSPKSWGKLRGKQKTTGNRGNKAMITLSLIRKAYNSVSVDDLVNFETLNLSNRGVSGIDNLELFGDKLTTLDLSNNQIGVLENMEFLMLETLMVQNNRLMTKEDLNIEGLPRSLRLLDITGNPVCKDADAVTALKSWLPQATIITGVDEHDLSGLAEQMERLKAVAEADGEDGPWEEPQTSAMPTPRTPRSRPSSSSSSSGSSRLFHVLDSDAVLRELVERKNNLEREEQNVAFDLKYAQRFLDEEADVVLENRRFTRQAGGSIRDRLKAVSGEDPVDRLDVAGRIAAMRSRHAETKERNTADTDAFMAGIRKKVADALAEQRDYELRVPDAPTAVPSQVTAGAIKTKTEKHTEIKEISTKRK